MSIVQVMDNEQLHRAAPSIFATEAYSAVSERYTFIPTIKVIDALRNEGFLPVKASQSKTRIKGKSEFTKHLIRFRRAEALNIDHKMEVGTELPELVLVNSHDRSSGFQLSAGIFRLACANGLIVKSADFGDISVRHSGNIVDEVIEGSCRIIKDMPTVMADVARFKRVTLDGKQAHAYATAALALRYPEASPIKHEQLLAVRRVSDTSNDVWTVFNRVQENFMRGGLRGVGSTGRRTKTRAIKSVNEDLRLNKALWVLTEEMARLANGGFHE
jgi:hypothetical protein